MRAGSTRAIPVGKCIIFDLYNIHLLEERVQGGALTTNKTDLQDVIIVVYNFSPGYAQPTLCFFSRVSSA